MTKLHSGLANLALVSFSFLFPAAHVAAQDVYERQPEGVVILNGEYLKGPYSLLEDSEGRILINGRPIDVHLAPEEEDYEPTNGFRRRMMGRPSFSRRSRDWDESSLGASNRYGGQEEPFRAMQNTVNYGGVAVVSEATKELEVFPRNITLILVEQILGVSKDGADVLPKTLEGLLPQLQPDPDLLAYAKSFAAEAKVVEEENMRSINRVRLLDGAAYPLSTLGMCLVVLATGQLLLNRPPQRGEVSLPEVLSSNTTRFVMIIIAFSILDLVWTMLASHDGAMKELNPIGSQLTQNPILLVAYKVATTAMAATILICLRKVPNANLASWWMCLLLTLLTARWLVFNSLLV